MRAEPAVIARQEALGATPARAKDLEPLLSALAR
jgi:uridine kinase